MAEAKQSTKTSPVVLAGAALSVLGAIVLAVSGPGYRMGWWPLGTGFNLLRWAAYAGAAGVVVSILGAIVARPGAGRRGFGLAVLGILIGGVVFWMPYAQMRKAGEVPRIHDITTDTTNPPQFVAVLPLRAGSPNSTVYGGAALAAQQEKAYPDIKPLEVKLPPDQAFDKALAVAQSMGWHIDATDKAAGRIEATDTTFWFGFKDDIVVRVQADPGGGSRIDVRSESRIGRSDIGTNARRIRKYLAALASAQ
ncbi:MAG TPA: DUF1499 domain-containing protein [Vicinamibacterales bacterium]|nr:DUF1499 domain-containing protein [Vicinamibacterales bacterium]